MDKNYIFIDAPSDLGLKQTGVTGLGAKLKQYNLLEKLNAEQGPIVDLGTCIYSGKRDGDTGYLNMNTVREYTYKLSEVISPYIKHRRPFIVLGGDCSILLGSALALKKQGRYGLLFLDGHSDFYDSRLSETGEVAELDLGIVTGHGHPQLDDIDGLKPYFKPEDTVLFGFREERHDPPKGYRAVRKTGIHVFSLDDIRKQGFEKCLRLALQEVTKAEVDGFFIHLDADVLDDALMPAVDYRLEDGLSFQEVSSILKAAVDTGSIRGLDVTIYNPNLDQNDEAAIRMVACLAEGLS